MAFKAILKAIVDDSCGGLCGVIMGYDGIAIDEYLRSTFAKATADTEGGGLDVQMLIVEYASVLKEIKRTVAVLKTGDLEEVSIITEQCSIIVRGINDDFFIALIISADGNFGKGRYLLKRAVPQLREELQ